MLAVPVLSVEEALSRERIADRHQAIGDGLTQFRRDISPFLGRIVAATDESLLTAFGVAGTALTDQFDGKQVRKATVIRGYEVETDGARMDPEADACLVESVLEGLEERFIRQESIVDTLAVSGIGWFAKRRNNNMKRNRQHIEDNDIDPKEMGANIFNKYKMWIQCLGLVTLSVAPKDKRGLRNTGHAIAAAGTVVGEIGERIFRRKTERLISEKRSQTDLAAA